VAFFDFFHGQTGVAPNAIELHPIWGEILNGSVYTCGPQNGGSPAGDRSSNAAADCRDHGQPCVGYP